MQVAHRLKPKCLTLAVGDVIFNHNMHQRRFKSTKADIKQLRDLQTQKSTYTTNYQTVEVDRHANLAEYERLNKKVVELTTELGRIKKELAELNPRIFVLNTKLNNSSDRRIQLYTLATSLDPSINHLLHQKDGLEKNLSAGEAEIAGDRKEWDHLRQLFDQAKQTLFTPPLAPPTSAVPLLLVPPVGINERIIRIATEVDSVTTITVVANEALATTIIGAVNTGDNTDTGEGHIGTSSANPANMAVDSAAQSS